MLDSDRALPVAADLAAPMFADPACWRTVDAARRMAAAGRAVDALTVADLLAAEQPRHNGQSWHEWLSESMDLCATATYAADYAESVRAAYRRRRLGDLGRVLAESTDPAEIDAARRAIADMDSFAARAMPTMIGAHAFCADAMPEPPQVIGGVLHQGAKLIYGGPSKAFKSWTLIDLCLAVATGGEWFGMPCTAGRVLYINFELQPFALHKRILAVADDRRCDVSDNLVIWNMRGHAAPLDRLIPEIRRQARDAGFSLIVPDPIYKALNGRDENAAGDIGEVCAELDRLAVATGAAVAFGAHFAKGNASGKDHMDRVSGSGVWARDPDAILTATAHEDDGAFVLEMTLRNFAPVQPFVIRWVYPRMRRDDTADPSQLRKPRGGKEEEFSVANIMEHFKSGMTTAEWQRVSCSESGMSRETFYRRLRDVGKRGEVERIGGKWAYKTVAKDD